MVFRNPESCGHPGTDMAHYVIDVTRLFSRARRAAPTGIDRVVLEYALAFGACRREPVHFCVWLDDGLTRVPNWLVATLLDHLSRRWLGVARVSVASPEGEQHTRATNPMTSILAMLVFQRRSTVNMVLRSGRTLARSLRTSEHVYYINVSHKNLDLLHRLHEELDRARGLHVMTMVHDLMPVLQPEYYGKLSRHFERALHIALQASDIVITNSHHTAEELVKWASANGRMPPSIRSLPLGVRTVTVGKNPPTTSGPGYFVYIGSLEQRKNVALLLDVWERLVMSHKRPPELCLIGDTPDSEILRRIRSREDLIHALYGVSDEQAFRILSGARALLLPSHMEGFGLPVLEAISVGIPVLCSDLPALREVGEDVPEYLGYDDIEAWTSAVEAYAVSGSPRRREQLNRIAKARPRNWALHFEELFAMLGEFRSAR